MQRADTSVGPYRGSKVDLYFGGVANHDCEHGRGMPRPYKNERSVTWRSDLFILLLYRIQICLPRVRARRPGAGRGYGVQRIRGTGAGSPDPLALAERAENSALR